MHYWLPSWILATSLMVGSILSGYLGGWIAWEAFLRWKANRNASPQDDARPER